MVDTDIGTNVDDCLALAFLARSSNCDLGGSGSATTIVTGRQERRIALAKAVYLEAGLHYEVYGGESEPLSGTQLQVEAPLADFVPVDEAIAGPIAADVLCDRILNFGGQVTLLCLGPLTNLAMALRRCPALADGFHKIVMMGGCFGGDAMCDEPETNMRLDPLAAAEVFAALGSLPPRDQPVVDLLGYEVTSRCSIDVDELERRGASPLCVKAAKSWLGGHPGKPLGWHDALAAVHAASSARRYADAAPLVTFQRGNVVVDSQTGATSFSADSSGFANIAVEVSREIFAERYFSGFQPSDSGGENRQ